MLRKILSALTIAIALIELGFEVRSLFTEEA